MWKAYVDGEASPPMSDNDFRDFVAAYVVLKDEPGPLRGEDAAKAMADAFDEFDKVTKCNGYPLHCCLHIKPFFLPDGISTHPSICPDSSFQRT